MLKERQVQLFNVVLYGGKKLRGFYDKKEKEVKKINPYLELSQIREQIANYFPIPLMAEFEEKTIYGYITLWYQHYKVEDYEYNGEMFTGEDFKIIEAELTGTERLNVEQRLYLHKKLFDLVKSGLSIQDAAEKLQAEIKKMRLDNGIE